MCQSNSTRDDGGRAFPSPAYTEPSGDFNWGADGMTLRDYAAIHFGAAWAIALGTSVMPETRDQRTAEAARLGLLQADAMLAARGKP